MNSDLQPSSDWVQYIIALCAVGIFAIMAFEFIRGFFPTY